jgi:hypothetical protein
VLQETDEDIHVNVGCVTSSFAICECLIQRISGQNVGPVNFQPRKSITGNLLTVVLWVVTSVLWGCMPSSSELKG